MEAVESAGDPTDAILRELQFEFTPEQVDDLKQHFTFYDADQDGFISKQDLGALFEKVELKSGESATLSLQLDERALAFWDASAHAWETLEGDFAVEVGASSCDIRLNGTMTL